MDATTRSRLSALQFMARGSVAEQVLRALERDIGTELPADYAQFLRATGGGRFGESILCRCRRAPPVAVGGRTMLGEFLGIAGDESMRSARRRTLEVGMSPGLVPIADAAGGDYYCLRGSGPTAEVVYWDHDSGKSYLVANSLFDLIARLEVDVDRPAAARGVEVQLDPDLL